MKYVNRFKQFLINENMDPIYHHLSVLAGVDEKTAAAFLKKYGSINLNLITTALKQRRIDLSLDKSDLRDIIDGSADKEDVEWFLDKFNESINENVSYKKLISFIKSIKTYMDIEDEDNDDEILLRTRDHGNVGNETVGREDIEEARRVRKIIAKKFPDLKINIEGVDEWVHLNITKPEEPKFEYVFIKRDDDGAGFSEGFDSMKDLIKKYKTWIDGLNWKKITKEAEAINQFPNNQFNGWLRSNDMLISKEGSKGNKWGYSFYIAKEKSKV